MVKNQFNYKWASVGLIANFSTEIGRWKDDRITYSRWNKKYVIQESYVLQNYPSKMKEKNGTISGNQTPRIFLLVELLYKKKFGSFSKC